MGMEGHESLQQLRAHDFEGERVRFEVALGGASGSSAKPAAQKPFEHALAELLVAKRIISDAELSMLLETSAP